MNILYLIDIELSLDLKDSENDWKSDGPALSSLGGRDLLLVKGLHKRKSNI